MDQIIIGQIGLGHWGPNLLRNFSQLTDCSVKWCCDINTAQLEKVKRDYPQIQITTEYKNLLTDDEIQALVIATPAPMHYIHAREALEAGKHVFVEKPLALKVNEAENLVRLSGKVNRKLMVGHLLLYHPAVKKLKELIDQGELGDIYYIYTQRLNLGKIRNTENVLWSLAPHDISVVLHLIKSNPIAVASRGSAFIQRKIEDVVFLNIKFARGEIGNIHVSWLDPTKTRRSVVVGSKKMAIFDEISARNTLTLIDRGVDLNPEFKTFEEFLKLRFGEEQTIEIDNREPLKTECQHFIDCIRNGKEPLSNGENGLAVLKVLDAAQKSLNNGGRSELL